MSEHVNHGDRAHAKLSASGAKRWMACPRSVLFDEVLPEKESPFALEGTQAHETSEAYLRQALGHWSAEETNKRITEINPDTSMIEYSKDYAAYCSDAYKEELLQDPAAYAIVESKLTFNEWVPGGFGTGDFAIVSNKRITIIDFKYGKGVKVDAEDNPQMRLYALGTIQEYGFIYENVEEVAMHIYQPRLYNTSVEIMKTKDLLAWGDMIMPLAKRADSMKKEYHPGEHCKFCKARATCKARAQQMLNVITDLIGGRE